MQTPPREADCRPQRSGRVHDASRFCHVVEKSYPQAAPLPKAAGVTPALKEQLNPSTQRATEPSQTKARGSGPSARLSLLHQSWKPPSGHTARPPLTCLHITQPLPSPPALPAASTPPRSNTPTAQLNLIKIRKKFAFSFHCTPGNHRSSSNFENFVPLLIISLTLHFKAQRQSISLVVY